MTRGQDGAGLAGRCEACGIDVPDGPDACLGWLAGVTSACCGHGSADAYHTFVMLEDGRCLRGNDALAFFATAERVDRDPHPMHCAHCGVELGPVVWLDGDRMLCREGCDGVYLATTFILRSEDDIAWDRYIHDALD